MIPPLETKRLSLEPIRESHAAEIWALWQAPELYLFIPQNPPTLEALQERYRFWEAGISPDGKELWLNWMARERSTGAVVGHFQAGVPESKEASLGYTIALPFQRQGFASEAIVALCECLDRNYAVPTVRAWIDTRNHASIALIKKLGFRFEKKIFNADEFKGQVSHEYVYLRETRSLLEK